MNIPSALPSILLFLYAILLLLSIVVKGNYILENLISLLPYLLAINLLILTSLFLVLSFKFIFNPLTIAILLLTFVLTARLVNFSYMPTVHASSANKLLSIAFLNKLYSNTNYSPIDQSIKDLQPDILAFAEMKTADKSSLTQLSDYPYQLNLNARDDASLYFFSKFPATKNLLAPNIPFVLPITLTIDQKPLYIFLVHPFPPASNDWVKDRDQSLFTLANYIKTLPEENVLLLGDFNLSPWSNSYQSLTDNLPNLHNVATGQGLKFSWHGGVLKTQIDHIFIPKNASVENFATHSISGSDHNLISAQIKI